MSPRQVAQSDVDEFVTLLRTLEDRATDLLGTLHGSGREEGAETVRAVAASMIERAREGTLGGRATGLPLSRPFGEWDYGSAARPVWEGIDAVVAFWGDRLADGDFEVVR
jgi:hypothetical protein